MKVKLKLEIDTKDQEDLNTIQELIEMLKELAERIQDE